jgi:hypothetical protein
MAFGVQEIKERDAALIVMQSVPPDEKWFRMCEDWFVRCAGEGKEQTVRMLFHYARNGATLEHDARQSAKVELAEMLESMARQIRQ